MPPPGRYPADPCRGRSPAQALPPAGKAVRSGLSVRFLPAAGASHILQTADLYVHTAIIEIEAIACTEAICCGLVPVICNSDRSATRFFACGDHTLFEPGDVRALADLLDYWYEHPAARVERAAEYADLRHSFDQTACMQQMEQMLKEAAGL